MKSCLIVDGSIVVRTVAKGILEDLGFETEEAADGEAALAVCERRLCDAVLLDWDLPVMDAFEFLRALRALPGGDAPAVIFCTANTEIEQVRKAIAAGADEVVMKPFDGGIIQAKFSLVGLL